MAVAEVLDDVERDFTACLPHYGTSSAESGGPARLYGMCRNIRTLHNFDPPTTNEEVREAALQYVPQGQRLEQALSGERRRLRSCREDVAAATSRLLAGLTTSAPPKDREVEAAKRRARAAARFAA